MTTELQFTMGVTMIICLFVGAGMQIINEWCDGDDGSPYC